MAASAEQADLLPETINHLSFVAANVIHEQLWNELPDERVHDIASRVQYEIVVSGCNFVRKQHGLTPIEETYQERRRVRRKSRGGRPRKIDTQQPPEDIPPA